MKKSIYNNIVTNKDGEYLYFNSASGAIAWFDKNLHDAVSNNFFTNLDNETMSALEKQGFIVNDSIDEYGRHMNRSKQFKMDMNSDLSTFVIAPTMACNLRCVYCFECGKYSKEIMSEETQDHIFNFITKTLIERNKKRIKLTWFGGEPMLAYPVIEKLSIRFIDFCEKHNIQYTSSMVTNATLLNEEIISDLVNKYHLTNMQITLDGDKHWYKILKRGTDKNFEDVINNIRLVAKTNVMLAIRLNVCKENIESFKPLLEEFFKDKDFHAYIYVGKLLKYSDTDIFNVVDSEDINKLTEYIKERTKHFPEYKTIYSKKLEPKGASCGYMVDGRGLIDHNGLLYRCEHQINDPKFAIGDVVNGYYYNTTDSCFLDYSLPLRCRKCSVMPVCMGGCISDIVFESQKPDCKGIKDDIFHMVKTVSNI
jgi:uncharacterized protein